MGAILDYSSGAPALSAPSRVSLGPFTETTRAAANSDGRVGIQLR